MPGVRSCVCRGIAYRHGAHLQCCLTTQKTRASTSVSRLPRGPESVSGSFASIDAAIACAALRALPQQRASFMRRLIARFSRLFLNSSCFRQGKRAGHGTVQAWHRAGVCACVSAGSLLPLGMQSSCCSELLRDCATSLERWCAGSGVASICVAARRAWDWRRVRRPKSRTAMRPPRSLGERAKHRDPAAVVKMRSGPRAENHRGSPPASLTRSSVLKSALAIGTRKAPATMYS